MVITTGASEVGPASVLGVCMQCVAQSAPLVGVTVTVLNRRNLKAWFLRPRSRAMSAERASTLLLFDEFAGEDPGEARALSEWQQATGARAELLALFGRGASGKGARTDRRALFQIVTDEAVRPAPPLAPTSLRRRLLSKT